MKKTNRILVVLAALLLLIVGQAFAYSVVATGDQVFLAADSSATGSGVGNFSVFTADTEAYLYDTFCVEQPVYFTPGTTYYASISQQVQASNVPLDQGSKYLYWHFSAGTLTDIDGAYYSGADDVSELQAAIWAFQAGTSLTGNGFYDVAAAFYDDDENDDTGFFVSVMNLWTGMDSDYNFTGPAQSQLIIELPDSSSEPDPVPEPATVLLLGSGLVGLALYRRRMKK